MAIRIFVQRISIITLMITFALSAQARDWKRVKIPNAFCGNGKPYSVFVEIKDTSKLAVEFMGGGACWSRSSCKGPNFRTILFQLPKLPAMSTFSADFNNISPVEDYSYIYFPYCTGDVFAGNHTASYTSVLSVSKVNHHGYSNTVKAIEYLSENIINFKDLDNFVLYGASAGAIGSLIHAPNFEKLLPESTKRTMIADSPGLHFGKTFWDKFTPEILMDFDKAFSDANFNINFNDGLVTDQVPNYCQHLSNWNIGIIQSLEDIVMSSIFGEISPKDHRKLVLGEKGLVEMVKGISNCSAFVPKNKMHTFLLLVASSFMKIDKTTVLDYTREVMSGANRTHVQR